MLASGSWLARATVAALPYAVFLYALATLTSMAGMEIFGTLAQLLVLVYFLSDIRALPANLARFGTKADLALLLLFATTILAVFLTDPVGMTRTEVIGSARWMLLFFLTRSAVSICWGPSAQPTLGILIFIGGAVAGIGVLQYFTGFDPIQGGRTIAPSYAGPDGATFYRAEGLFGFTMTFAHSMSMTACFPFAFALMAVWKRRRLEAAVAICAALCALAVVASLTRGAWISLALAFLTMSAFAGGRRFLAALAALPIVGAALWAWVPGVGARAATIVDSHFPSNAERFSLWRANWEMFKDHPLVGVGYGMNELNVAPYLARIGAVGLHGGHAHNNYLQFLSGTGAIGLACYLFFSLYFLWISIRTWFLIPRERAWERAAILSAIGAQVAMHVGGLTECNFKDAEVNHQFLLILAVAAAIHQSYVSEHGGLIKRPRNEPAVSGI